MSEVLAYLGPSISRRAATEFLPDAIYMPPIKRGDLFEHYHSDIKNILIIDGEFGQSLSVSITEIKKILSLGVTVWGASSMGALRAVECYPLGMKGVGWVYGKYQDGEICADDEVALQFHPDFGALTIPLVNVRWSLGLLSRHVDEKTTARLFEVCRAIHWAERTESVMLSEAEAISCGEEMRQLIKLITRYDRKKLDAIELLSTLNHSRQI